MVELLTSWTLEWLKSKAEKYNKIEIGYKISFNGCLSNNYFSSFISLYNLEDSRTPVMLQMNNFSTIGKK